MKQPCVLVACEESGRVTEALRNVGVIAYSADILPTSGNHPEWHIQGDVLPILNGDCDITVQTGKSYHIVGRWNAIIAFPPCTDLCVSGARHFEKKRQDGRQEKSIRFFCQMIRANAEYIAVENPVGIISGDYCKKWFPDLAEKYGLPIKYTQVIQPYYFGIPVSKKTCLWLKGFPPLEYHNIVEPERIHSKGKTGGYSGPLWYVTNDEGKILSWRDPETAKQRSKTFIPVAEAMGHQWGNFLKERYYGNERTT